MKKQVLRRVLFLNGSFKNIKLSDYNGKQVILYCYPGVHFRLTQRIGDSCCQI